MKRDENNTRIWYADEGKVFRRKKDGIIMGGMLHLGVTYRIGNEILPEPKKEIISQYEEIDIPEEMILPGSVEHQTAET